MPNRIWIIFLASFLVGCSGLEQSEQEKLRRMNIQGELIYRAHDEYAYGIPKPIHRVRDKYPWEEEYRGNHAKITKEYFRCKGNSGNPPHADHKDPMRPINYFDCGGAQKHSLPIRDNTEFIYPVLIDLLNAVQSKTGKKVVITCGYRCPTHHAYADNSVYNQHSKHLIGAEVDFYVQGMEHAPEEIVQILMEYYLNPAIYHNDQHYTTFERLDKGELNVSTPPWYNKEILIKLYKKTEGRDFDNQHPYPYLSIQVRYDRDLDGKVICDWQKAFNCYRRY